MLENDELAIMKRRKKERATVCLVLFVGSKILYPAGLSSLYRMCSTASQLKDKNILSGNLNGSCRCLSVALWLVCPICSVELIGWCSRCLITSIILSLSTQPRAFTRSATAFPLSFYFRGSVASSAPGDPAYSSQVSYWTKGWLIDSSLSEWLYRYFSGVALDVPCVTIWESSFHGTACVLVYWNGAGTFEVTLSEEHKKKLMPSLAGCS